MKFLIDPYMENQMTNNLIICPKKGHKLTKAVCLARQKRPEVKCPKNCIHREEKG